MELGLVLIDVGDDYSHVICNEPNVWFSCVRV